jgi:hypothetical protein
MLALSKPMVPELVQQLEQGQKMAYSSPHQELATALFLSYCSP